MAAAAGAPPVLILKEGTTREQGRGAQFNDIAAARAIDPLIELRSALKEGKATWGVDPLATKVPDMGQLGVLEPIRVAKQALASAVDTADMVLQIDDMIAAKTTKAGEGKGKKGEEEPSSEFT